MRDQSIAILMRIWHTSVRCLYPFYWVCIVGISQLKGNKWENAMAMLHFKDVLRFPGYTGFAIQEGKTLSKGMG